MKAKHLLLSAGIAACLSGVAVAGGPVTKDLQTANLAGVVKAQRLAGVRLVGENRVQFTTPWIKVADRSVAGGLCPDNELAYDAFDPDVDGFPTNGNLCDPNFAPDTRWFFGAGAQLPIWVDDIAGIDAGFHNAQSELFLWAWSHGQQEQSFILVFTAEDFFDDCTGWDLVYDGVIFDFGDLAPGDGYYIPDPFSVCLSGTGLFFQMPEDGSGASLIILASFVDDQSGEFEIASASQVMMWGTSDAGGGPNRPGTTGPVMYVDGLGDDPADGLIDTDLECFDFTAVVECPDPLAAMQAFWAIGGKGPDCPIDYDGNGFADGGDFLSYLSFFFNNDQRADLDGNGRIDGADFLTFLSLFFSPECAP